MIAASLFGVFIVAKLLSLWGTEISINLWSLTALLWQDALLTVVFAVIVRLFSQKLGWALYGSLCVVSAANAVVVKTLFTPITWPLLRAARGPLVDSFHRYLTLKHLIPVFAILMASAIFPLLFRRRKYMRQVFAGIALTALLLGPIASHQTETLGLHRNVFFTLFATMIPKKLPPSDAQASSRKTEVAGALTQYRGKTAGHNIVMIALESTAAQYLRIYGAKDDPMPYLTKQSEKALIVENAYAVYPESIKGLYSVLCSKMPGLHIPAEDYTQAQHPSMAGTLREHGYRTALFHSGRFDYLGMNAVIKNRGYDTLDDAGAISKQTHSSFGIDNENITVRHILSWIDHLSESDRFFVHYLPIAGHHPYLSPDPGPFAMEEDIDRYKNALHHADRAIHGLLDGLKQRSLRENTFILFYGDHGEAFGQHAGNFAHTLRLYEENIRVPLLILAPFLKKSVRLDKVVSLLDVAPTVLDLMGMEIPLSFEGTSLLDNAKNTAFFFTDYSLTLLGLRHGNWKFVYEVDTNRAKLFDLRSDPHESKDLARDYPQRVFEYRKISSARIINK